MSKKNNTNSLESTYDAGAEFAQAFFGAVNQEQLSAIVVFLGIGFFVWIVRDNRLKGLLCLSGMCFAVSFLVETKIKATILQASGLLFVFFGAYRTYAVPAGNKRAKNSKKRAKFLKELGGNKASRNSKS